MRRIMSAVLCIALLFCLGACGAEKTYVPAGFKSDVAFQMGDITVRGTLEYALKDNITFTVTEPENVSGTVFTRDEICVGDIKTGYGKVADSSPVRILLDVVADISSREIKIPLKGEFTYSGDVSSAGYKIIFDCENNKIATVEAGKFIYTFE